MDHEVIGRQRAEPGRDGQALQREECTFIAAMSVVHASARKRGIDHLLGVVVQRIALGRERRIAHGRGERRPQRAGVADQDPEASLARQDRESGLAGERGRIERVRDVEAGRVEDGERVHAVTMAQSPRARAPDHMPDRIDPGVSGAWEIQDAEARFSELLRASVEDGPQTVSRRGVPLAVLVSVEQWNALRRVGVRR